MGLHKCTKSVQSRYSFLASRSMRFIEEATYGMEARRAVSAVERLSGVPASMYADV